MNNLDDKILTEIPAILVTPPDPSAPLTPPALLIVSSSFTTIWGIWFLIPWATFDSSKTFDLMQSIAHEWVWGLAFLLAGLFKLYEVIRVIQTKRARLREAISNFIIFYLWSAVAISIGVADWRSTGTLTYGFFALLTLMATAESWAAYRIQKKGY
jgi:hypothetical protein